MKIYYVSLVLLFLSLLGQAQVYDFDLKQNGNDLIGATLINAAVHVYDATYKFKRLSAEEVDPDRLWEIDRYALGKNSSTARTMSDVLQNAAIASPFLFLLKQHPSGDKRLNIIMMGLEGILLESALNTMVKIVTRRPRPFVYNAPVESVPLFSSKVDAKSFYSGHAAAASYFSFFSAKVFSDLYPDSKYKYVVWSLAVGTSVSTAWLRVEAGKHFPTDVMVGFIVGAGIGYLIPAVHHHENISISSTGDGLGLIFSF